MIVMGLSGGVDLPHENRDFLHLYGHDSAAALVEDGRVVAAIEEERLNRIKHTNKGAISAIQFCLDNQGLRLNDLDRLVVGGDEQFLAKMAQTINFQRLHAEPLKDPRGLIHEMLQRGLRDDIDDRKLFFIHHHLAHAVSAHAQSGFDESLVLTIDGWGDDCAGMILSAKGKTLDLLQKIPHAKSLGGFYLNVIGFLGYELFDEYKVMGLAPYGNPERFRGLFKGFYELLPLGDFVIKIALPDDLAQVAKPRRKKELFTQDHKDIAAALQEALEDIVFHILRHYRTETNHEKLCMAGGVSHNCTLTGKLLYSGMFQDIFVQPSSHDAGLALGAALYPFLEKTPDKTYCLKPPEHVYWGTDISSGEVIRESLTDWTDFIEFEPQSNIAETTARLLANGAVVGWVQGRSEFGPRALGHRSIIADPRPAEFKDLINSMVKKRESYRPFAPAVLEEYASDYFDIPAGTHRFPFMTFVVKVREDKREVLRATTHVDGTARIQTVTKAANPDFWALIDAFRELTGVPVLLNTSFNNNAEPIVDSAEDAIVCFLTTQLNHLVIGDYLISKKAVDSSAYLNLVPALPAYTRLVRTRKFVSLDEMATVFEIDNSYRSEYKSEISSEMNLLLMKADGSSSFAELLGEQGVADERANQSLIDEVFQLWSNRKITLAPKSSRSL